MSYESMEKSVEDERCGNYIAHPLTDYPYDHNFTGWNYLTDPYVAKRLRGELAYASREDVVLATQRDLFHFVMVARPAGPCRGTANRCVEAGFSFARGSYERSAKNVQSGFGTRIHRRLGA
jgi:hypothetical protein